MHQEIERKFLVSHQLWKNIRHSFSGKYYRQGYISKDQERIVRIRTIETKGFLTIKSKTKGMTRTEFEYTIPIEDANFLLENLCLKPLIEKIRYTLPTNDNLFWEVDEFQGIHSGLILAEIELPTENFSINVPPWIEKEVTGEPQYYNSNLEAKIFQN